ncbi:MAG: NnrS family protein [Verrucomicrobiia bacterium]
MSEAPKAAKADRRISWAAAAREPFRLFFPAAVIVGLAGVALWPLHFLGLVELYPGVSHARLMAYGFFAGFMLGFLGTALPRMLSAPPLHPAETGALLLIYAAMSISLLRGKIVAGDFLFLVLLAAFGAVATARFWRRADLPPPGFVLVALAFLCAAAGAILGIVQTRLEDAFWAGTLQHLLVYQGFILLPILGVGAFLLPRFFGLPSKHNFPESLSPPPGWTSKALLALVTGLVIIGSFWLEATGWFRTGPAIRLAAAGFYLAWEVPVFRRTAVRNAPARILRLAFLLLLAGFLAIVFLPEYRISLLHMTLVGGFAIVTLIVATRVIFGHCGNLPLLDRPNRWLWIAAGLMILAMATRISGDFWPKVLVSHYSYGAVTWVIAVILWAIYVLPKVVLRDPDD